MEIAGRPVGIVAPLAPTPEDEAATPDSPARPASLGLSPATLADIFIELDKEYDIQQFGIE